MIELSDIYGRRMPTKMSHIDYSKKLVRRLNQFLFSIGGTGKVDIIRGYDSSSKNYCKGDAVMIYRKKYDGLLYDKNPKRFNEMLPVHGLKSRFITEDFIDIQIDKSFKD